jgi:hypothetical protein
MNCYLLIGKLLNCRIVRRWHGLLARIREASMTIYPVSCVLYHLSPVSSGWHLAWWHPVKLKRGSDTKVSFPFITGGGKESVFVVVIFLYRKV